MATIKTLADGVSPYPAVAAEPTVLVTTANGRPSTVAAASAVGVGTTVVVNGQAALNNLITANQSGVFDGANVTINLEEQNFNTTNQVTSTTNYADGANGSIQYNNGSNGFAGDAYFTFTNSNVVTPGIRTNGYFYGNGAPFTGGGNAAIGNFVFSGDVMTIGDANQVMSITGNGIGNIRVTSNGKIWTFNNVGNLILPSNTSGINYANGSPYGVGNYSNANVSSFMAAFGSNVVSTTGNITGNFFIGNGSLLTGVVSSYGNANVVANLAALGANPVSTTGIITAEYFIGNGSQLTGIVQSYGNANVVANLAALGANPVSTTGNITAATINANLYTAPGNVVITASSNTWTFGDGGSLVFPSGLNIINESPNTRILTNTGRLRITATNNAYINIGWDQFSGTGPVAKIYANGTDTGQPSNVVIKTGNFAATTYDWVFGNTGNLAAPGRISATNIVTNSIASDDSSFVTIEDGVNVHGEISATGNITGNYILGNGSQLTGISTANIGNVTFNDVNIIGDGNLRLQPGPGNADAYLDIYLTAGPDIHIAGNGESVILGTDAFANVTVNVDGNVSIQASNGTPHTWTFDTTGKLVNLEGLILTAGGQFNICTIDNAGSGYTSSTPLPSQTTGGTGSGMTVNFGYGLSGQLVSVAVSNPGTGYTNGDVIGVVGGTGTFVITQYNEQANQGNNNFIQSNWTFGSNGNLTLPGNIIAINYANGNRVTGNVTFSSEIVIGTGTSNLISGLYLAPSSSSANANMYLRVRGNIVDEPTHIHFDTGNNSYYNQFIGDDNKYIQLANTGNIVINSNDVAGNSAQWTFAADGNLNLPNGAVIKDTAGNAVTFGRSAGQNPQGINAVAVGNAAGNYLQGNAAVAVGDRSGGYTQGISAVAVGQFAGNYLQGNSAVAIGNSAGLTGQGLSAVAIGAGAGVTNQGNNSIIINATAANLEQTTANTFTVAPVRNDVANIANIMFYNATTKEITYGNVISVAGNITGNYFIGDGSQLTGINNSFAGEIHVSKNGNDSTGTGNILQPYLTVTHALTQVAGGRNTIVIHPGEYTENPTITSTNTQLITYDATGASTIVVGTVTMANVDSRIAGLRIANLIIAGNSHAYISGSTVTEQFTKSSSGYVEVDDCELQVSGNVLISGSGTTTIIGNKINNLVVNNAGAAVLVKGANDCLMPQVTAGSLNIVDSVIRASSNTANAVTASAGTVVTLMNNQIVTPAADNVARVSIAGFHSIISLVYDKANSTLSNSLNSVVYFQTANVDSLVSSGNITGGNILTAGLISATGNITGNCFIGNGSQLTSVAVPSQNILPTIQTITVADTSGVGNAGGGGSAFANVTVSNVTPVTEYGVIITSGTSSQKYATGALGSIPGTVKLSFSTGLNSTPFTVYAYVTSNAGTFYSNSATGTSGICLLAGTQIALSDGTHKAIEDITYTDKLLSWDFDRGCYAETTAMWIKRGETGSQYNLLTFSDGTTLRTFDQHRIFNKQAGAFTYPMTAATPVGTVTVNEHGQEITLTNKQVIEDTIDYYNVITDYHMNLFSDTVLTSCRFNNIYPVVDMKFAKDSRTPRTRAEFTNIPDRFFHGLRLAEQTADVETVEWYVNRLVATEVSTQADLVS